MAKELYAEDLGHYWQTSQTSPDTWIEKARREIVSVGGTITLDAFGSEPLSGRAAFVLEFQIAGDRYRLTWPVLRSRTGREKAARIQAATLLYHDVKARCLSAKVLGACKAFFSYVLLPDGRAAGDAATPDVARLLPAMFGPQVSALPPGVVDGEVVDNHGRDRGNH